MGKETIETDPEMTQIIVLLDKDIKIVIIAVFHITKQLEERLNMLHRDVEDIQMIEISLASEIKKKYMWWGTPGGSVG